MIINIVKSKFANLLRFIFKKLTRSMEIDSLAVTSLKISRLEIDQQRPGVSHLVQRCIELLEPSMIKYVQDKPQFQQIPLAICEGLHQVALTNLGRNAISQYIMSKAGQLEYQKNTQIGSPMKMLFVLGEFPHQRHAGGLRIFDIIVELSKSNEIWVYTCTNNADGRTSLNELMKYSKVFQDGESLNPSTFLKWLRDENTYFDVAYHTWIGSIPLIPASKSFAKKVFYELIECDTRRRLLELDSPIYKEDDFDRIAKDLAMSLLNESTAANSCDGLIAVTPADAAFAQQVFGASNTKVIPTGISEIGFLAKLKDSIKNEFEYSACFVGYYNHTPNIDALVWYFENIHESVIAQIPNYTFSVIGKGNLQELRQLYGHLKGVIWVGEVEEVASHILKSKICLSPLISGAGIRGKINQYSISGRATVSTSIGICGTPYIDNVSVLVADDPNSFSTSIVKLLRNEILRSEIALNAAKVAKENFSWPPIIEQLATFIRDQSAGTDL